MAHRVWLSWSSGKDSAWALHTLRSDPQYDVVGLLTTCSADSGRVAMHEVRRELLEAQAAAAGLPLHVVELPSHCPDAVYEKKMSQAVDGARREGVTHMAFGDLFLRDIRSYRESMLAPTGMQPLFPLWDRPTDRLAREMIAGGLRAVVTCIDPRRVDRSLCGRSFDDRLLDELGPDIDPCAEHGEFHTFAYAGPMFERSIDVDVGEISEREGFVFADLRLVRSL